MRYVLTLVFLLILTGCFSSKITPSKQVTTAQDAVAKQEKKVDETYDELVKNLKPSCFISRSKICRPFRITSGKNPWSKNAFSKKI